MGERAAGISRQQVGAWSHGAHTDQRRRKPEATRETGPFFLPGAFVWRARIGGREIDTSTRLCVARREVGRDERDNICLSALCKPGERSERCAVPCRAWRRHLFHLLAGNRQQLIQFHAAHPASAICVREIGRSAQRSRSVCGQTLQLAPRGQFALAITRPRRLLCRVGRADEQRAPASYLRLHSARCCRLSAGARWPTRPLARLIVGSRASGEF